MAETVTIDQIKDLIKAEKLQPSDLFGVDAITSDPAVKGYVENETRRAVAGEYAHRKRGEEGFDKTREDLDKKVKTAEAEVARLKLEGAKGQVSGLFEKQKATRKLTEQQAKFVQARLKRFEPQKVEDVEKEFNTYLDAEIDECGRLAKDVFGIEDKTVDGKKPGAEPHEPLPDATDSKYLDPAKNPMIKI